MFAVTRFRVPDDELASFTAAVAQLLVALRARPGSLGGWSGSAADEPGLHAVVTTWEGVGAYRRALSAAEVKVAGAPVWLYAVDEPGAYLED